MCYENTSLLSHFGDVLPPLYLLQIVVVLCSSQSDGSTAALTARRSTEEVLPEQPPLDHPACHCNPQHFGETSLEHHARAKTGGRGLSLLLQSFYFGKPFQTPERELA